MAAGIPYLGSKISLISKSEVRYEGILYTIDTNESTVALAKVRSFGTEDRPTDRPVAPREEVYEYIIFRGSDIKDIRVCQPPKPQPTLQGGLPNDPAIVQHSANRSGPPGGGPFSSSASRPSLPSSNAAPGSGRHNSGTSGGAGGQNFGPIGTGAAVIAAASGPSYAGNFSAPGQAGGAVSNESPVMDLLRESGSGGPVVGLDGRTHQDGTANKQMGGGRRGGRGGNVGPVGFHRNLRGGRGGGGGGANTHRGGGRGGGNQNHSYNNYRGGGQNFRGGNRGNGGNSGFVPGRPTAGKKETLKFDSEYDFEQANEKFQEVLQKLQKTSLEGDSNKESEDAESAAKPAVENEEAEDGEIRESPTVKSGDGGEEENGDIFYDKKKSFFDSISCEALERSKGKSQRPGWRAEKKLNKETFGVPGHMGGGGWRGRGGYGGRGRGYGGYGGGRGQGYRNYGYNQGYNQGGGYQQGGGYNNQGYSQGYNNYNNGGYAGGNGRFSREQRSSGGERGRGAPRGERGISNRQY